MARFPNVSIRKACAPAVRILKADDDDDDVHVLLWIEKIIGLIYGLITHSSFKEGWRQAGGRS
jgi:hypothetical protein